MKIETTNKTNEFNWKGLILSLVCGVLIGGIVYCLTKVFHLKEWYWYIPFFVLPPIVGAIIFMLSKPKY